MKKIDIEEMRSLVLAIADRIIASKPLLTEVDSKIGDGDHGIGMETGFLAVQRALDGTSFSTINQLFRQTGMAMLNSMGGASGIIFSSIFLGGIKGMSDVTEITCADFSNMMKRSLEAIQKRGNAKLGDKTMVDAFAPACAAMTGYAGEDFAELFARAAEAAYQGVENTKMYVAKFGRAKSLMDRAIGFQDAGATSVWIIWQAAADWARERGTKK